MNSYGLLDINGIEIYHEDYGQGVPVLLLHGNSEDMSVFEDQIPYFSRYFRVIALDSRGHGRSTRNVDDISYEAMANDVLKVLNVMGIPKCHVVGFSDGGIIALELAQRAPERLISMIIIGTNYKPDGVKLLNRCGITFMYCCNSILALFNKKFKLHKKLMQLMLKHPNMNENALANITTPTLIVVGSHDMIRLAHTHQLASLLQNSQLDVLPHCNHFVLNDQPNLFNKSALDFLLTQNT